MISDLVAVASQRYEREHGVKPATLFIGRIERGDMETSLADFMQLTDAGFANRRFMGMRLIFVDEPSFLYVTGPVP